MKDKQEQIEKMAKCVGEKNFLCADDCENCIQIPCKCKLVKQSKLLYKAGYRKASDVIDEFMERLRKRFEQTETIANCLHGRTNTEIDGIIKIVAAEMRQEVEE